MQSPCQPSMQIRDRLWPTFPNPPLPSSQGLPSGRLAISISAAGKGRHRRHRQHQQQASKSGGATGSSRSSRVREGLDSGCAALQPLTTRKPAQTVHTPRPGQARPGSPLGVICQSLSGTESCHASAVAAAAAEAEAADAAWLSELSSLVGVVRRPPPAVPAELPAAGLPVVLGLLQRPVPGCLGVEADPVEGPLAVISTAGGQPGGRAGGRAGISRAARGRHGAFRLHSRESWTEQGAAGLAAALTCRSGCTGVRHAAAAAAAMPLPLPQPTRRRGCGGWTGCSEQTAEICAGGAAASIFAILVQAWRAAGSPVVWRQFQLGCHVCKGRGQHWGATGAGQPRQHIERLGGGVRPHCRSRCRWGRPASGRLVRVLQWVGASRARARVRSGLRRSHGVRQQAPSSGWHPHSALPLASHPPLQPKLPACAAAAAPVAVAAAPEPAPSPSPVLPTTLTGRLSHQKPTGLSHAHRRYRQYRRS